MNRDIVWTNQFKKDYKLAQKQHLDVDLLDNIIRTLDNAKRTAPLSHDRESGAVFLHLYFTICYFSKLLSVK